MAELKLCGERVLVLEDEPLIAIDIAESLSEAGANIIRAHGSLDAVRRIRNEHVSAAVLDVNLGQGDDCSAVCDELSRQGVPFIFYTGHPRLGPLADGSGG
jgi:DNA-binding response OmpR family regulator